MTRKERYFKNKEDFKEVKIPKNISPIVEYFSNQLDIIFDAISALTPDGDSHESITTNESMDTKEEELNSSDNLNADNMSAFIDHLSNILPKEENTSVDKEEDREMESIKESIRSSKIPALGDDLTDALHVFDKLLDDMEFKVEDSSLYKDLDSLRSEIPDDATANNVLSEEFINWGLDLDREECRDLLYIVDNYKGSGISKNDSIEDVDSLINLHKYGWLDRALTYVRDNADFSKSKYFTILGVMPRDAITNDILYKNIIDLCED